MTHFRTTLIVCTAFIVTAGAAYAQTPPRYTVTDLGTLGGKSSEVYATAINNRGEVVGASNTTSKTTRMAHYKFATHAFLWQKGKMRDLGSLGGDHSEALALNDRGDVVGFSELPKTDYYTAHSRIWLRHAFLYAHGKMQDLGTMPGDLVSIATGINAQGQIVGTSGTGLTDKMAVLIQNAVLWSSGRVRLVNPSNIPSEASGINRYGLVAGKGLNGNFHPVVWNLLTKNEDDFASDSTLGQARAVNSRGQAVGNRGNTGGPRHAFLSGADLPLLPGYEASDAEAINNLGFVVGLCASDDFTRFYTEASHASRGRAVACLWQSGRVLDLNLTIPAGAGWILWEATGINDKGQIVGNGNYQGKPRAFLLTPIAK